MTANPTGPDAAAWDTDAANAVLASLQSVRGWQEELYRDLHAHPELPHAEHRTAATVATGLREAGFRSPRHFGGTGVVGLLCNGAGPMVLLRADMDALPVREETGLPYASTVTAHDGEAEVPLMHACGHDVHVACLVGAVTLLAQATEQWSGTLVAVFQPVEESADGARAMLGAVLAEIVGDVDVAMAQHVLPLSAGQVGTRAGVVVSAADSMRITVHGRGAHGSMPQAAVDPVVLAAMIVVRLQTVVAREVAPGSTVIEAIERIVRGECQASGSPREPEFELFDRYPLTDNEADVTGRVARAFTAHFGDLAGELPQQSASEDFSHIPRALSAPYTYWGIGGVEPETYRAAEEVGRVSQDIPVNHSAGFAPVIQPTLDNGTRALIVAAREWLHH